MPSERITLNINFLELSSYVTLLRNWSLGILIVSPNWVFPNITAYDFAYPALVEAVATVRLALSPFTVCELAVILVITLPVVLDAVIEGIVMVTFESPLNVPLAAPVTVRVPTVLFAVIAVFAVPTVIPVRSTRLLVPLVFVHHKYVGEAAVVYEKFWLSTISALIPGHTVELIAEIGAVPLATPI